MASYTVNQQALARARQLIDARQYVLKSIWNDVQPSAAARFMVRMGSPVRFRRGASHRNRSSGRVQHGLSHGRAPAIPLPENLPA